MDARPRLSNCFLPMAGAWIIVYVASFLVATTIFRFLTITDFLYPAILASVFSVIVLFWTFRGETWGLVASLVLAGVLVAGGVTASTLLIDWSWDGQAYHLPNALDILGGWNPLYSGSEFKTAVVYPNGLWTLQALLIGLFDSLEGGKAVGGLLALASIPFVALALKSLQGAWTPWVWVGLLALYLNPVLLYQALTFEADGPLYTLVLVQIAAGILLSTVHRRMALVIGACAMVMLVNLKLTGLYWAGLIALGTVTQCWLSERDVPWRLTVVGLAVGFVAVFLVGWRPYVTSSLETGRLFSVALDVVPTPLNLIDADLLTRFLYLLSGELGNPVGRGSAALKWPWEISAATYWPWETLTPQHIFINDIMIGGFGPWIGLQVLGGVVLVLGAAMAMRGPFKPGTSRGVLARPIFWAGLIFTATLFFPIPWWARLVSPFWACAILMLMVPSMPGAGRAPLLLTILGRAIVIAGMCINSLAAFGSISAIFAINGWTMAALATVAAEDGTVIVKPSNPDPLRNDKTHIVWQLRLNEMSIKSYAALPGFVCGRPIGGSGSIMLCQNN